MRAAVVVLREDHAGEKRLVAYVVGDEPGGISAEALRTALSRDLPAYMIPSAFVFLDALPLTPNGKMDKKALPSPDFSAGAASYVAPRTPMEEMIVSVFAEVLGVAQVGVNDDFFALGGHSLLAMRVMVRLSDLAAVEVPLRMLFEMPTAATLAPSIEGLAAREVVEI